MNSNLDGVPGAFQTRFLQELLGDPNATDHAEVNFDTGDQSRPDQSMSDQSMSDQSRLDQSRLDQSRPDDGAGLSDPASANHPIRELGEHPTVQARFQTLLKQRFEIEAQRQPPLFPWETEVVEYLDTVPKLEAVIALPNPQANPWLAQLTALSIPTQLPEQVFATLLGHCQRLAQTTAKEGAKLVQAVAALFPEEEPALNDFAGFVLRPAARSVHQPSELDLDYETAGRDRQMVLALMAARELLESLTLVIPTDGQGVERQWLTAIGPLTLRANCVHPNGPLDVKMTLPCAGEMMLQGDRARATAECAAPGTIGVCLDAPAPHGTHTLTVRLCAAAAEASSLTFSLVLAAE
jgi:hypothetical protein